MSSAYPKACSCGAIYPRTAWQELPYVGIHDDGYERLELRNCTSCGSTIAVSLGISARGEAACRELVDALADTWPPEGT